MTREPDERATGSGSSGDHQDRRLLLQCRTSQVTRAAEVADRPGSGLVVTAERDNLRGCLGRVRHLLEVDHYRRPVLLDAARYAGAGRLPASAGFDRRWIECQRDLGLPVLTDSGYLAPDDMTGLVGILEGAARLGDATAVLPVHPGWLADRYARNALLRYVNAVGVPVAVIVERPPDPVDGTAALVGLLHLLRCDVPVLLLRAGLSALGALCSGAAAAAIGTDSALRQLDLPAGPPGHHPPTHGHGPSALVRQCLSHQPLTEIEATRRRHPDNGMWQCRCATCDGRDLGWLARLPEEQRAPLAARHSVDVLLDLRAELTGPSVQLNQWSWQARCAAAASRRREVGWDRLPTLDYWQRAIPAPTSASSAVPAPRRRRPERTGFRRVPSGPIGSD
ncbi:hypothetical protein [Plantactinospora sp. CA-290183]|uniref:hypothetical protein n=1 Tax=Plantactinospora sp. CA-290183 TaxID=3240006 RepID=UPI003D900EA7